MKNDSIKKAFYIFGFSICAGIISIGGLAIGGLITLIILIGLWRTWPIVEEKIIIRMYNEWKESVFIIGCHPETEEHPNVIGLEDFCIFVNHDNVREIQRLHRSYFYQSGNESYCDDSLSEDQRINVEACIFQDGDRINETWQEYQDFVCEYIQDKRAKRHALLKQKDKDHYDQFYNSQKGVIWEVPKVNNKTD